MIKQVFDVESYFKVIVYYNVDYDFFNMVEEDLNEAGISKLMLRELWLMMYSGKAKAVTYSNVEEHVCVVLFNYHEDENESKTNGSCLNGKRESVGSDSCCLYR